MGIVKNMSIIQIKAEYNYLQLSISSVQFCSSSGYLLRSIIQAAVVVILGMGEKTVRTPMH